MVGASLFERAFAIMLHIGLSVMVMRAVEDRDLRWLGLAILVHFLANLAAVTAQRFLGVIGAEAVVAAFGLGMLWFTLSRRPRPVATDARGAS
jgi:uncharacterized membrane protein YhfC